MGKLRTAWRFWRQYRHARKEARQELRDVDELFDGVKTEDSNMAERTQALIEAVKPAGMVSSTTTQNSVAGVATGGVSAYGLIVLVRSIFGERLPWTADQDVTVAALATVILGPIAARILSFLRSPRKAVKAGA